ncbi:MAG: hypothetical protein WC961_07870 [Anaerovoracaceae bacterium]
MQRINKLNTIQEAQRELSRLIRSYYRDEIETAKFRTLVYAFSILLSFQKTASEQEIEKRLTELEQKVGI